MAEARESFQERTEEATPKRREDARREGQVARSMELNSSAVLLMSLVSLLVSGSWMIQQLRSYLGASFRDATVLQLSAEGLREILAQSALVLLLVSAPLMLSVLAAGLLANIGQVGFLVSTKTLEPRLDKLNPIKGLRTLFSARSLAELVKSLLKIASVGLIVWLVLKSELPRFLLLIHDAPEQIMVQVAWALARLMGWALLLMLVLTVFDVAFQRWDFSRQLRMTVQEVKEERKQTEGDPSLKSRIRGLQLETAYNRMLADLPRADVVITNPIRLAVALKYEAERNRAPLVVAKGKRKMAERIRQVAREHGVPVVENRPLARALFRACEVGVEIPGELYRAVAEVLAFVLNMKRRSA